MAQSSLMTSIEPYRRGTSFADWVDRLGYVFVANNITDAAKKAHFITLSGPAVYTELKLLYPNENLSEVAYADMIGRLKSRLDKTESDLIQRFKFYNRVQQPDESLEDFVLSVKLQAEFCSFGTFKIEAIRDRIVGGVREKALQQRLLNEDNLSLEAAEKILTTWEMASSNAKTLNNTSKVEHFDTQFGFPNNSIQGKGGNALDKLIATVELARKQNSGRMPIKSRLGFRPYRQDYDRNGGSYGDAHSAKWRKNQYGQRSSYEDRVCSYCGVKGHLRRKCFKLKNNQRDSVKFISPGESDQPSSGLSELLNRMKTKDSDSEDDQEMEDSNWKRAYHGTPSSN
ncbi:uncharacterized protein LOC131436298 [Malaya genurostris]|uniref:uncharacterized protein LOC131426610 n=1 Tax=Malaya genurostris TaxID=325434 RepID=UPI0026F400C2|nr:uncharacterized protein LOC131426610 [Malaya genurostris]XP_058460571.1 uncharacterized protein LOC131436098 [Malaya genurostris]XP_058460931.1 uncharacterized protein LOC131436298 [Malaya genurostris]